MKKIILIILFALLVAFIKSFVEYKYFSDDKPIKLNLDTTIVAELDTEIITELDTMIVSDIYGDITNGRELYKQNCTPCHNFDRDLSGPRITTRIGYGKMYEIIRNINDLEKNNDAFTIKLLREWDKRSPRMPEYQNVLSDKEIAMLVSFLKFKLTQQKCIH